MEDAKSAGANSMGLNGVFFQEITEAMPVPPPIGEDQADSEPQSFQLVLALRALQSGGWARLCQQTIRIFLLEAASMGK